MYVTLYFYAINIMPRLITYLKTNELNQPISFPIYLTCFLLFQMWMSACRNHAWTAELVLTMQTDTSVIVQPDILECTANQVKSVLVCHSWGALRPSLKGHLHYLPSFYHINQFNKYHNCACHINSIFRSVLYTTINFVFCSVFKE